MTLSLGVITGVILLFINIPFGLGSLTYFMYLGKKNKNKKFYYIGFLLYFVSWLMFFAGLYLCGESYSKFIIKNYVVKYVYWLMAAALLVSVIAYIFRKKIFRKIIRKFIIQKKKKHYFINNKKNR